MNRFNSVLKRLFDITFAVAFLIVFLPVYVITALVIVISSPGNPIYKAERIGKDRKVFTCYKFRSMRLDSGKVRLTTLKNDERIFPFGKFIRKVKIDEMPQAVNILLGQMSVVGPRPEDKENADKIYVDEYVHILDAKPGLTSPASLYDYTYGERIETQEEYEADFLPKKLYLELYYVENRKFILDIKIVIQTAVTIIGVLFGKENFAQPKALKNYVDKKKEVHM